MSFISCTGFDRIESQLTAVSPTVIYQQAARTVASETLEPAVQRAITYAGGSNDLADEVGVYTSSDGIVYVGLPRNSPHTAELGVLEHGDIDHAPAAPVLTTVTTMRNTLSKAFGAELSAGLDEALR